MTFDLIAYALVGLFAVLGALAGTVSTGVALFSIVAAYAAAFFLGPHYGPALVERTGAPAALGAPLAGVAAFFAVYLACGIGGAFLKKWDRVRRLGAPRTPRDRVFGAVFGAARGGLVVLVLVILLGWLDAARDTQAISGLDALPDFESSSVARAGGDLLGAATRAVLDEDDPAADFAVAMVSRPGATVSSLQGVLESEALQALQADPMFWTLVENGDAERAMRQVTFLRLSEDPAMREELVTLGVVDPETASDPEKFRAQAKAVLEVVGPKLKRLRSDPQVAALAEDPEVQAMVEAGDTLGLIGHPGIQKIMSEVAAAN